MVVKRCPQTTAVSVAATQWDSHNTNPSRNGTPTESISRKSTKLTRTSSGPFPNVGSSSLGGIATYATFPATATSSGPDGKEVLTLRASERTGPCTTSPSSDSR